MASPCRPFDRSGFEMPMICALPIGRNAIEARFDEFWEEHDMYTKASGEQMRTPLGGPAITISFWRICRAWARHSQRQ